MMKKWKKEESTGTAETRGRETFENNYRRRRRRRTKR